MEVTMNTQYKQWIDLHQEKRVYPRYNRTPIKHGSVEHNQILGCRSILSLMGFKRDCDYFDVMIKDHIKYQITKDKNCYKIKEISNENTKNN